MTHQGPILSFVEYFIIILKIRTLFIHLLFKEAEMNQQAFELAERLATFSNEVIALVEQCSDEAWQTACSEDWSLGVVARHIGAGHFRAVIDMTKMIVAGQPLPEITPEQLVQMANEHAHCTKAEVLAILLENGTMLRDYAAGLSDEELNRTTHMEILGGELTAGQFMEAIILQSGGEHLASMKAALGQA